jgi:hypothetical protein
VSDTPYKRAIPAKVRKPGSPKLTSWPAELRRTPAGLALASQDTIFNGARILAQQHTGGSAEWMVDNTATGGGTQSHPEPTVWRTAARCRATLCAGQALDVRMLAVPSGASVTETTGLWFHYSSNAQAQIVIGYENVGLETDSVTVTRNLPGSEIADGLEDTTAGAAWRQLQHHFVGSVRPQTVTPAYVAKFSEWPTVTFEFKHKGGARVLYSSVTEVPLEHVAYDSNDSGSTLHDFSDEQGGGLPVLYPQTKAADGATYQEHRFGTHHGLHVAERQRIRVGPTIATWSAYAERLAEVTDTEADPITVTSTTFVGLSIGSAITAWAATNPGYDVPGSYCAPAPENLYTRVHGNSCSIPIRIRAYVRCTANGAGSVFLKMQPTPRTAVTLTMPQVNTFAWYTTTGWIEGNVSESDHYAILQDFAKVSAGVTAEIRYWSVEWGAFPVAN